MLPGHAKAAKPYLNITPNSVLKVHGVRQKPELLPDSISYCSVVVKVIPKVVRAWGARDADSFNSGHPNEAVSPIGLGIKFISRVHYKT